MELPATDAIMPRTHDSPVAGADVVAVEVTVEVEVDVDVGLALLDELQAAMDKAVAPARVTTANRESRGV
jgi:hypothetical protein